MTKLKLTSLDDEKPVKLTVTLPAALYQDLAAYAEILSRESGKTVEPARLIPPMLEKFIASDRGFRKMRSKYCKLNPKSSETSAPAPPTSSAPD